MRVLILDNLQLWQGGSNSRRGRRQEDDEVPQHQVATVVSINGTIQGIIPANINNIEGGGGETTTARIAQMILIHSEAEQQQETQSDAAIIMVALSVVSEGGAIGAAKQYQSALQAHLDSHSTKTSSFSVQIAQGKVLGVGEALVLGDQQLSRVGRRFLVCPGFIDSHVHFFDGGRRLNALSFGACKSREDFINRIRSFLRERYVKDPTTTVAATTKHYAPQDGSVPLTEEEGRIIMQRMTAAPTQQEISPVTTTTQYQHHHHDQRMAGSSATAAIPWLAGNDWSDVKLGEQPTAAWIDEALTVEVHSISSPSTRSNGKSTKYVLPIPAVFYRIDCHSCVINSEALRLCGIDESGPPDPEGGTIVRYAATYANAASNPCNEEGGVGSLKKRPTGMLREKAMALARIKRKESMNFDDGALNEQYNIAASHLLSHGITSCFSMSSLEYDNLKEIEYLMRRPVPPPLSPVSASYTNGEAEATTTMHPPLLRIRTVVTPEEIPALVQIRRDISDQSEREKKEGVISKLSVETPCCFGDDFVSLGAVKVFADGALGSRTAAMEHPYGDLTGISSSQLEEENANAVVSGGCGGDDVENDSGRGQGYNSKARATHNCPCGLLLSSVPELYGSIRKCSEAGLQCCVHGIGDRAVLMIQDAFEAADADQPSCDEQNHSSPHVPRELTDEHLRSLQQRRNRIEHCQHVSSMRQLQRFARSHTIPSVQPCHLLFDGDHVERRLGPHRARLSYPLSSMIAATRTTNTTTSKENPSPPPPPPALCFGTDWMVTSIDPIANIQAAMLRQPIRFRGNSATALPVWCPEERLTFRQCLAAYTTDAAYAAFWEKSLGRIEVGYKADFTILSLPAGDEVTGGLDDGDEGRTNPFAALLDEGCGISAATTVRDLRVEGAICDARLFF